MPSFTTLLLLMLISQEQRTAQLQYRDAIGPLARRRRDRRITRRALQSPALSQFMVLFNSMCDQSLITCTGIDHSTFVSLLRRFEPLYLRYTLYSQNGALRVIPRHNAERGRPRSMNAMQCLRLPLAWDRTRGENWTLCMLFGITGSICFFFVRFARRILLRILRRDIHSRVRMQTAHQMAEYRSAFFLKYRSLVDVYAVADGLKLYFEQSKDFIIQNMFYNGCTQDHCLSNIFVFAPAGTIIACAINAPGSVLDSQKAEWGGVYEKLEKSFNEHGGRVVVDFAVPRLWFSTPTSDGSTTHASARVSRNGVLVERKHTKSFRVRANSVTLGLRACETLVSHIFGEIAAYDRDEFLHDSKSSFRGRRRCREFFSCGGML